MKKITYALCLLFVCCLSFMFVGCDQQSKNDNITAIILDGESAGFTNGVATYIVGNENQPNPVNVAVYGATENGNIALSKDIDYTIDLGNLNFEQEGTYTITYAYIKDATINSMLKIIVKPSYISLTQNQTDEIVNMLDYSISDWNNIDITLKQMISEDKYRTISGIIDQDTDNSFVEDYNPQNEYLTRVVSIDGTAYKYINDIPTQIITNLSELEVSINVDSAKTEINNFFNEYPEIKTMDMYTFVGAKKYTKTNEIHIVFTINGNGEAMLGADELYLIIQLDNDNNFYGYKQRMLKENKIVLEQAISNKMDEYSLPEWFNIEDFANIND